MKRKHNLGRDIASIIIVTLYLILYCVLLQFENTWNYAILMLVFSPALVIWMVYIILKYGIYQGPDLGKEEFGYLDKNKDDLGIF